MIFFCFTLGRFYFVFSQICMNNDIKNYFSQNVLSQLNTLFILLPFLHTFESSLL